MAKALRDTPILIVLLATVFLLPHLLLRRDSLLSVLLLPVTSKRGLISMLRVFFLFPFVLITVFLSISKYQHCHHRRLPSGLVDIVPFFLYPGWIGRPVILASLPCLVSSSDSCASGFSLFPQSYHSNGQSPKGP
jgi:hypothetical protein